MLPSVKPSSGIFGYTGGNFFAGQAIPIAGVAGDQHAALFGQACFEPGMAKNTYGTGSFILMNTGAERVRSDHGLLSIIAWDLGEGVTYGLEGSIFSTGATVQWLRDGLQLIEASADVEALADSVEDNGGVYLVPAFTGLGAPTGTCMLVALLSELHAGRAAATSPAPPSNPLRTRPETSWTR